MRIAILSNINTDMLAEKLAKEFVTYHSDGYNNWMQDLMQPISNLYLFKPNVIYCILDGRELFANSSIQEVHGVIDQYLGYIEIAIKANPNIYYFISDIDTQLKKVQSIKGYRFEREIEFAWYRALNELCQQYRNLYIFELKILIEVMGRENFYSNKMWYLASIKYSVKGERSIVKGIKETLTAIQGKRKKCLILDLDNTLWGGVVGEDGFDGIALSENKEGARYKDFQRRIKEIKDTGVILAIASKNNYDDAMEVIEHHPDMVLKKGDFVATKINWDLKTQNIKELSNELNISKDSFVFIDDSQIEREMVKSQIPEIVVPDFPKDTCELSDFITEIYRKYFLTLETTAEDLKKTEMYEKNFKRIEESKQYKTIDNYLLSLQTRITIKEVDAEDITRAAQLTQKTNQFNFTTKRYKEADITDMINDGKHFIYIASVEDKFGDNGKCVLVIVKENDPITADIDSFIISCRVMGRFIEDTVISYIEDKLYSKGFKKVIAHYCPTKKNVPARDVFERFGYCVQVTGENKDYKAMIGQVNLKDRKLLAKIVEG